MGNRVQLQRKNKKSNENVHFGKIVKNGSFLILLVCITCFPTLARTSNTNNGRLITVSNLIMIRGNICLFSVSLGKMIG